MTEMFGEAWSPMSVPDLAPDDDDDDDCKNDYVTVNTTKITDSQYQLPLVPVNVKLSPTLSLHTVHTNHVLALSQDS